MSLLLALALAAAPAPAPAETADAAAPRPRVVSATAHAVAQIIRFERAAPDPEQSTAVLQRHVDIARREVAFF